MSAKSFFKGKAFKCLLVLTSILLVCGVLLSIAWGFLKVTDEERFNRKIGELYGGDSVTAVEQDISGKNTKVNNATIQNLWFINEKNDYVVQATSRGNGGDVICWVAVHVDESKTEVIGISKVLLYGVGDAAEYTGNIPSSVYGKFSEEYTDGKIFSYGTKGSDEFIGTGASYTMTAICNDVNGAVAFVKAFMSGVDIVDPYAEFEYTDYMNMDATTWTNNSGEITLNIVTTANPQAEEFTLTIKVNKDGDTVKITAFEIVVNGSTEGFEVDMSPTLDNMVGKTLADIQAILAENAGEGAGEHLHTGATRSNELCFNAAAFALANYDKCLEADKGATEVEDPYENFEYTRRIDMDATAWTNNNGEITYSIVTTGNGMAEPFTLTIKVSNVDGTPKITAFVIVDNGSSDEDFEDAMSPTLENVVGMTLAEIQAILAEDAPEEGGEHLHTGATRSNELCFNSLAFALANYDECLKADKEVTK